MVEVVRGGNLVGCGDAYCEPSVISFDDLDLEEVAVGEGLLGEDGVELAVALGFDGEGVAGGGDDSVAVGVGEGGGYPGHHIIYADVLWSGQLLQLSLIVLYSLHESTQHPLYEFVPLHHGLLNFRVIYEYPIPLHQS